MFLSLLFMNSFVFCINAHFVVNNTGFHATLTHIRRGRGEGTILVLRDTDINTCSVKCILHQDCITINFNEVFHTCELTNQFKPTLDSTDDDIHGWMNYGIFSEGLCKLTTCQENAECIVKGRSKYECKCKAGYEENGSICRDVDECESIAKACHSNAVCTNSQGSYQCECAKGYEGDGKTECTDINECHDDKTAKNCHDDASCINNQGSYVCRCNPEYVGDGVTACRHYDCVGVCHVDAVCRRHDSFLACSCKEGLVGNGSHCASDTTANNYDMVRLKTANIDFNTIIHTFEILPKVYTITFLLELLEVQTNHISSVLHFTIGGNSDKMGDRIPFVSLYGDNLKIASSVNTISNSVEYPNFPVRKPIKIKVEFSITSHSHHWYRVYVDEKLIKEAENNSPSEYKEVKVYYSDKWHKKARAKIHDLTVFLLKKKEDAPKWKQISIVKEEIAVNKSRMMTTLAKRTRAYMINLEVKPMGFIPMMESIAQFLSNKASSNTYGYCCPCIWLTAEGNLRINFTVNGPTFQHGNSVLTRDKYKTNEWIKFRISQIQGAAGFNYSIVVNGKMVYTVINTQPDVFFNVEVHISGRDEKPLEGFIKNVWVNVSTDAIQN